MVAILLLEDDFQTAELVKRMVRRENTEAKVTHAPTTTEAVEALNTRQFDVVLSDLALPDSEGRETVERLLAAAEDAPVIVLTGLDDDARAIEMLLAGAQDYISKNDVTPESLARSIRYAIHRQLQVTKVRRLMREAEDHRELLATTSRKLEQMGRQAQIVIDNVSHDFRTPLTVIKKFTSLIRDEVVGVVTDEQRHMLDVIEDRSDDLNTMVSDLLESSKLESGSLEVFRTQCTVSEIVNSVIKSLRRKAEIRGVTLSVELGADLPEVYCDSEKIARVITNLTVNAIRFSGRSGAVSIVASQPPGSQDVSIRVTDSGAACQATTPAIDPTEPEQLGIDEPGKGLEIGLNVAKELVDLSLGELTVQSEPGGGSSISFTVPMNDPPHILANYLGRVTKLSAGPTLVSLVSISVKDQARQRETEGVLNYILQSDDLLVRQSQRSWMFATPTSRDGLRDYLNQSRKLLRKTNRNRVDPLSDFEFEWLGTWQLPCDVEGILAEVAKHGRREICLVSDGP